MVSLTVVIDIGVLTTNCNEWKQIKFKLHVSIYQRKSLYLLLCVFKSFDPLNEKFPSGNVEKIQNFLRSQKYAIDMNLNQIAAR